VGLTNLGSELEKCVGSRIHLVGVSISFEKNFYRLPFTPPLSGSPYRSFTRRPLGPADASGSSRWLRRAAARAGAAALAKEKKIRRHEQLDRYNEENRLRDHQGLSPPAALANSSSDDEEESDGERTTSDRWNPRPHPHGPRERPWN
jgi:hypothetical protein